MTTDPTPLPPENDNAELAPESPLEALQAELLAAKDQTLRALAEADNTRKRAEREKQDTAKYAITGFARDLLQVMDTFERALAGVPAAEANSPWNAFAEGVKLTARELEKVFTAHGLNRISPLGEKFDHNFHQAMMEVPSTGGQEVGTVAAVLQTGYSLHDRLVRPALVSVVQG